MQKQKSNIDDLNYEASSACAQFWNVLRTQLPDDVRTDSEIFLTSSIIIRMDGDPAAPIISSKGEYSIGVGPSGVTRSASAEHAPP